MSNTARVRRMLAMVPWVAARPDGASIAELCERFDVSETQLLKDLETVMLVGVAPYTPDLMVEVVIEDDRVWITLPVAFDRPFRLTPNEGLALLAAGSSLLSIPGADDEGPLARGLRKIADLLGVEPGDNLHVDLGAAVGETMAVLRDAIASRRQVQLDYYSYGRDEHAVRVVDPHRVWADAGQWYLAGHCHLAQDERVFRVDRIADAVLLETPAATEPVVGAGGTNGRGAPFNPTDRTARVVLDLAPGARWVLDQYPIESAEVLDDGWVRATLAVAAVPWLERLLLRLGPDARVVRADDDLAPTGPVAARRLLQRYL